MAAMQDIYLENWACHHYIICMREIRGYQEDMRRAHSRHAFAALDNLIDKHYIIDMRHGDTMTKTLAEYLRERNAATEAWVAEDPANRWAGTYTEDLAHWAEIGVLTMRDFLRYEMETQYSDLYKEVYGFRPRGVNFSFMSYEELADETDYLMTQLENQAAYEAECQARQAEIDAEQERERLAWLAEQPEPIDYVACKHQEGWL